MKTKFFSPILLRFLFIATFTSALFSAQNIHWSKQFPKPMSSTKMSGMTGMSDGNAAPKIRHAMWYKGKLYMAGNWRVGVKPFDTTKRDVNYVWNLWTWNKNEGYKPISWYHTAKGGDGPEGKINSFCFLPDGRLVVAGEFGKLNNYHGHSYHRIKNLAVLDPKEPTANRWQPLVKSVQHNAPIGSIKSIAYDPQGNDLWIGGSFSGFRMDPNQQDKASYAVQRYNLSDKKWYIIPPGVRRGTIIHKIKVDTSTKPSTIYMAGRFANTGGNGVAPINGGTDRYTEGFCAWREDKGFITFPQNLTDDKIGRKGILQNAGDFAYRDSVNILDFLIDGKDIWIVGAFKEGTTNNGKPIRGVAKWDHENQMWIDPTGKGGLGRDAYSIAKTEDGKIYISGAFGGEKSKGQYYDGFKNGDKAYMVTRYDPATNKWEELGAGLGGYSMPECRLTVSKNDVFFIGTFKQVGRDAKKDGFPSYYIARWNEYVDFSKQTPPLPDEDSPYTITFPAKDVSMIASGLEHWSRKFVAPPRQSGGKTKQGPNTGMDKGTGTPTIKYMKWHDGVLYFAGSWEVTMNERWFVWTYDSKKGWNRLAYKHRTKSAGFASPPEGLKWHDGKMYVYGSNEKWKGIAIYDPKTKKWSAFEGTYRGKPVRGNAAKGNPAINDIAWDSKTGDIYLVGVCGEEIRYDQGEREDGKTVPSQVLRVDKNMVYHPMGLMLSAQKPDKPVLSVNTILLDETKTPVDIYVGGSFGFWGMTSDHTNAVYNVAKWDYDKKDWQPIGKGNFWRIGMHDRKIFPKGYPGLKGQPIYGFPTFMTELFGKVRSLAIDKKGNLYAGGSIGILDDNPDINKRDEHYGLVKYDKEQDKWVGATKSRGVSRDVVQMTWLDDTKMLVTGSFLYSEDFKLLNNVAIFDTQKGTLEPLGGGLLKGIDAHVYASEVVHDVREDGYWFGGFFSYAGSEPKFLSDAPVESFSIAHYNPNKNLDPNQGLKVEPNEGVKGVKGSSQSRKITLKATCPDGGKIIWYSKSSTGKFRKVGTGTSYKASFRVREGMKNYTYYVSVKKADGLEGGKLPVLIEVKAP
ncbi:MAG: hypothetical protein CSA86_01375 [Arcobacter sp.]|nr:MAG: hypothetical protein CSA86_01375 [Arcobacter sp.]